MSHPPSDLRNQRIVCAGEVMIELAADPEKPGRYQQGIGGDTFNTAIYLARAGLDVDYLTKLGDDLFSAAIIETLRRERIGDTSVTRLPGREPGLYMIRNDSEGERHFTYWRDNSPARELFDEPLELAADVFYFTGITLAVTLGDHANLLALLQQLKDDGCQIVFDPNYRPRLWRSHDQAQGYYRAVLPLCHTVLPTLDDDTVLWGTQTVEECHAFYSGYNVSELAIKAPNTTVYAFSGEEHQRRQAPVAAAVDSTGAGDAFNAGYLAARLSGADLGLALAAGQDLATRVVQQLGAIIPCEAKTTN